MYFASQKEAKKRKKKARPQSWKQGANSLGTVDDDGDSKKQEIAPGVGLPMSDSILMLVLASGTLDQMSEGVQLPEVTGSRLIECNRIHERYLPSRALILFTRLPLENAGIAAIRF